MINATARPMYRLQSRFPWSPFSGHSSYGTFNITEVGRENGLKCQLFRSLEADRGAVPGEPEQSNIHVSIVANLRAAR